jgi:hypothetical protein
MSKSEKLTSAKMAIENKLNADPTERLRMMEARILADGLRDLNSRKRGETREKILRFGRAALPVLLSSLEDTSANVRWQAAKALSQMHDPETAADLVNAMEDDDFGVRWLAAKGLIAMGPVCLEPLLWGLKECFDSMRIREGARHVLHVLADNGHTDDTIEKLLHVLQGFEPPTEVAWAAEAAWKKQKKKKH